jgi:hypothetical protein
MQSLNKTLGRRRHTDAEVEENFAANWSEFASKLKEIRDMDVAEATFVQSEADGLAGVPLSSEARALLLEAVRVDACIARTPGDSGFISVKVNTRQFVEPFTRRESAFWNEGLNLLHKSDLVQPRGDKNMLFDVTAKGYRVADLLERLPG